MKEIIEYITTPGNIGSFLLSIAMLSATIVLIEKFYSWATSKLKNYYDFKRGKETEKETIQNQDKRIKEVDDKLDTLSDKIDSIAKSFNKFEERQKSVNTILLRDKIKYIYKECISKGYILEKSKQDFKYAYDEYIANGGNSYVRDEVEPYIHNLKVYLSDEDAKREKKDD